MERASNIHSYSGKVSGRTGRGPFKASQSGRHVPRWQEVKVQKNDQGRSELIIENVDSLHDNSTLVIKKGELGNTFQVGIAESSSEYDESEHDMISNAPVRIDA